MQEGCVRVTYERVKLPVARRIPSQQVAYFICWCKWRYYFTERELAWRDTTVEAEMEKHIWGSDPAHWPPSLPEGYV